MKKNTLIESAARLMSNQSEMGDKPIHNLPIKKYYDSHQKTAGHQGNSLEESNADLADIKRRHTDAVAEIGRHRANHANWARAASPASQTMNPHSDRLHGAIQKAKKHRAAYIAGGGKESDLSKDMAESSDVNEELRTRKLGSPEEEFHTAFNNHLSDLDASNKATSPDMKNALRKRSQAHLQIAILSASMHYRKHGSPIMVKGNKHDELISSLHSPLVTKG
jgi:hypothetical protein